MNNNLNIVTSPAFMALPVNIYHRVAFSEERAASIGCDTECPSMIPFISGIIFAVVLAVIVGAFISKYING